MAPFVTKNQWLNIQDDLRGTRAAVTAVVSFVGKDGDTLMPLSQGDVLVCNAEDSTIKRGLTNPETLRRFQKKGVRIYSVRGLHAKVISGDGFAWVGSANASGSGYLEATIRVGATAARPIRSWANGFQASGVELTAADVTRKCALPRPKRPWSLDPPRGVVDLKEVDRLHVLWLGDNFSNKAARASDAEYKDVVTALEPSQTMTKLRCFESDDTEDVMVEEGSWFIPLNNGHPGRPCRVERVSQHGGFSLYWYREAKTSRRPRKSELLSSVPKLKKWDEWGTVYIAHKTSVAKVLALYL